MKDNRDTMKLIDKHNFIFKCQVCGRIASLNIRSGQRFANGYNHCPSGCTLEEA